MSSRIQVVLSQEEREAFRRRASAAGMSLSAWLRDAGRRRLAESPAALLDSAEKLRDFFTSLPEADHGREPDWEEHLAVIERSRSSRGATP